jgi:hypothetical protein
MECVCEELEGSPAARALEVVFDEIVRPLRIEKILKWASALRHQQFSVFHLVEKAAREFKILPGFVQTHALDELIALGAGRHCNSVTPNRRCVSHAEGTAVTLP